MPRLDVMLGRREGVGAIRSAFDAFSDRDVRDALRPLDRLGIAEHATRRAEALSGGHRQRVAIARALMQGSKTVLADEPVASSDPTNARS
ncbi:MAG TPA: ATP-binding cassette domain-containing protein [Paracoccaceae bacterium]|nr:ATP-binding cassette domain-containing protein [Paracoccaceae bacterium]